MRAFFRTGFKNFSIFPRISRLFILLSFFFLLSKSPCSHTTSPYSPSPLHQSSTKGMGLASFSIYFTFLVIYLLDRVFLLISVYLMREYGYLIFWWNCCVIFDGFVVIHFALCVQMCSYNTHSLIVLSCVVFLLFGITWCSVEMSPFKKVAVKGGNSKGKGPVIDVDDLSPR